MVVKEGGVGGVPIYLDANNPVAFHKLQHELLLVGSDERAPGLQPHAAERVVDGHVKKGVALHVEASDHESGGLARHDQGPLRDAGARRQERAEGHAVPNSSVEQLADDAVLQEIVGEAEHR